MSYILDASLLVGSGSRNPLPAHHHKTGVERGGIVTASAQVSKFRDEIILSRFTKNTGFKIRIKYT